MANLQPVRYPALGNKGGQIRTEQKPGRGKVAKKVAMNQGQKETKRAMMSTTIPKVKASRKNNPKQK